MPPISLVIPILWINKEIMSRGPQVEDMECQETTTLAMSICTDGDPLTTTQVRNFRMASTTPVGFRKAIGLAS